MMSLVCLTSPTSAAKWSLAVWGLFAKSAVNEIHCTHLTHTHTLAPSGGSKQKTSDEAAENVPNSHSALEGTLPTPPDLAPEASQRLYVALKVIRRRCKLVRAPSNLYVRRDGADVCVGRGTFDWQNLMLSPCTLQLNSDWLESLLLFGCQGFFCSSWKVKFCFWF